MRDIKFRGKQVGTVNWIFGGVCEIRKYLGNGCYHKSETEFLLSVTDISMPGGPYGTHAVHKGTIGQCTGLKDKNGIEIYEGDILHMGDPKIKYQVIWWDCGLTCKQISSSSYAGVTHWKSVIEVIGNIHDNPELLS